MHSFAWPVLTCVWLVGCVGGHQQLRQSIGPGPGPDCASTLDCACKNGSAAACEQLGTAPKAPGPPDPGLVMPPGTGKVAATHESGEPGQDTQDQCEDYYNRCVEAGGDTKPGRVYDQSICGTCMAYCKVHGFWPAAIYNWNQVRVPCPGS